MIRIELYKKLLLINILSILLAIIITVIPSNILRIIIGLPFVLFLPGYTLLTALFPTKSALDSIERVALSFGLSLAVVPIIAYILNFIPWGISIYSVLISIAIFIAITSTVGWYHQRGLAGVEKLSSSFGSSLTLLGGQSFANKILSIILILVILVAMGTLGYFIAGPKTVEKYTEFYIVGPEGEAKGYPDELVLGEEAGIIMCIVNHEHETVSYWVEVTIGATKLNEIGEIMLEHDGRWEQEIGFIPTDIGDNQKVEFFLYKQGQSESYRSLFLLVNVTK